MSNQSFPPVVYQSCGYQIRIGENEVVFIVRHTVAARRLLFFIGPLGLLLFVSGVAFWAVDPGTAFWRAVVGFITLGVAASRARAIWREERVPLEQWPERYHAKLDEGVLTDADGNELGRLKELRVIRYASFFTREELWLGLPDFGARVYVSFFRGSMRGWWIQRRLARLGLGIG